MFCKTQNIGIFLYTVFSFVTLIFFSEFGIVRCLGPLVKLSLNFLAGGGFRIPDQLQEIVGIGGDVAAELFQGGGTGLPDEEAVIHTLGIDFKIQTGILTPPFHVLTDADPQALLVGLRGVEPGIPVDPAALQNIAGRVQLGLEQFLSQGLHGLVQGVYILFFMLQEPVPVVVHSNAPEKIHSLGGEALEHSVSLFLMNGV